VNTDRCMHCAHWAQSGTRSYPSQIEVGKFTLVGLGDCLHPETPAISSDDIPATYHCAGFTAIKEMP
jgi:hypothetical protein